MTLLLSFFLKTLNVKRLSLSSFKYFLHPLLGINMNKKRFYNLVRRDLGSAFLERFVQQTLDVEKLKKTCKELQESSIQVNGNCVGVSIHLFDELSKEGFSPVIVAGSLKVNGCYAFKCPKNAKKIISSNGTDSHFWVQVDEHIVDASLISTARLDSIGNVNDFVQSTFNADEHEIIGKSSLLKPLGLNYIPMYVFDRETLINHL